MARQSSGFGFPQGWSLPQPSAPPTPAREPPTLGGGSQGPAKPPDPVGEKGRNLASEVEGSWGASGCSGTGFLCGRADGSLLFFLSLPVRSRAGAGNARGCPAGVTPPARGQFAGRKNPQVSVKTLRTQKQNPVCWETRLNAFPFPFPSPESQPPDPRICLWGLSPAFPCCVWWDWSIHRAPTRSKPCPQCFPS